MTLNQKKLCQKQSGLPIWRWQNTSYNPLIVLTEPMYFMIPTSTLLNVNKKTTNNYAGWQVSTRATSGKLEHQTLLIIAPMISIRNQKLVFLSSTLGVKVIKAGTVLPHLSSLSTQHTLDVESMFLSEVLYFIPIKCMESKMQRKWNVKVKVTQSCPTLCDPVEYTVHGSLQARMLEWVAFLSLL